jgi:hypothetical protein
VAKVGTSKRGGKQWQAQEAAYQSHTSRLTEIWSLPKPAQGLNITTTNNNNKGKIMVRRAQLSFIVYG